MNIVGKIIAGDGIGKQIGFPTLNILPREIPSVTGVFAVQLQFFGTDTIYEGVMHIGPRPTIGKNELRVEVFLFHFSQTIAQETKVKIAVNKKIRAVRKFDSLLDLQRQLKKDLQEAQKKR